jgi:hypothetical protein
MILLLLPMMLLLLLMKLLQRQGSVIVMIRGLMRRPMAATTVDVALAILRLLHQEQGAAVGVL